MILPVTDVAVITAGSHVRGVSATHARAFALDFTRPHVELQLALPARRTRCLLSKTKAE